jgi:hypothetical protein
MNVVVIGEHDPTATAWGRQPDRNRLHQPRKRYGVHRDHVERHHEYAEPTSRENTAAVVSRSRARRLLRHQLTRLGQPLGNVDDAEIVLSWHTMTTSSDGLSNGPDRRRTDA